MGDYSTIAYYLSLIGGSFTFLTGTYPFPSGWAYPGLNLVVLGSGIICLIFGHNMVSEPGQVAGSSLIVILMSLIAWWGILAGGAVTLSDFEFASAGPFLSFAGGIVGLSGSMGEKSYRRQGKPTA